MKRAREEGGNRFEGIREVLGRCHNGMWVPRGHRLGHEISRGPEARGQQPGWLPLPQHIVAIGSLELHLPVPLQVEPPELPEDLKHWITYNETSSQLLRAESGLSDRKDQ